MKFAIKMTETLSRTIIVEADNFYDAHRKVKDKYNNGDLILTADNSVVELECEDDTDNYVEIFGEDEYAKLEVDLQ